MKNVTTWKTDNRGGGISNRTIRWGAGDDEVDGYKPEGGERRITTVDGRVAATAAAQQLQRGEVVVATPVRNLGNVGKLGERGSVEMLSFCFIFRWKGVRVRVDLGTWF